MIENGMLLYHGSYTQVPEIDLSLCREGKDFGRGFYLTSSEKQARAFVPLSVKKHRLEIPSAFPVGYVSAYRLHLSEKLRFSEFAGADAEWLHFVAANRRTSLFPELLRTYSIYDLIAGKIANDQTARTLQLYVSGGYGTPGTEEADRIAISLLLPNRLEDQICFRSEIAVSALEYIGSEAYELSDKS